MRCILFRGSHGVNSDTMQLMERHLNEALHKKHLYWGDDPMINCLSSSKFANLLFVNVQIGTVNAIALFDTGAGMTVISKSLLHRLCASPEKETLRAGNNNGMVREFQTADISDIQIGDICLEKCKVLVTDDADFALSDESGRIFPAEKLLGKHGFLIYELLTPDDIQRDVIDKAGADLKAFEHVNYCLAVKKA